MSREVFQRVDGGERVDTSAHLFELAAAAAEAVGPVDVVVSANMDLAYVVLLARAFPAAALLYLATDSVLPPVGAAEGLALRLLAEELFFRPRSRGRVLVTCEKLALQTWWQIGFTPRVAVGPALSVSDSKVWRTFRSRW